MKRLPWTTLSQRRKALGLTQSDLAKAEMTQSLISQIERGRVMPSEKSLRYLAARLNLNPEQVVTEWAPWRDRAGARDRLWVCVLTADEPTMLGVLERHGEFLVPFEMCVYKAFAAALRGDVQAADQWLTRAWAWTPHKMENGPSVHSDLSKSQVSHANREADGFAGAWTKSDRARAMVAEAKVQALLCTRLGRAEAAHHWQGKVYERMQETV